MKELLFLLRRDFPEFEAQKTFEAAIPAYMAVLEMEVLEPLELTSFQWFFLRLISLGIDTQKAIARMLGVDERDLVHPGASLLKLGLIDQALLGGKGRVFSLTAKGRQTLQENSAPPVPKLKLARIHYNALTGIPIPKEEDAWSLERMGKEGLSILPAKETSRLTLGAFSKEEVASALSGISAFRDNTIISLLELKRAELQYIAPITVVHLQHQETGEQRLGVYRNGVQQRPETLALQRLFETGKFKPPSDAASLKKRGLDIPLSLPAEVAQTAQSLVLNEFALQDIEVQISVHETRQTLTQSEQERRELQQRTQQLKEELQLKREDHETLRQELQQYHVEFLATEQHRPLLEQALKDARKEIIIISPWMNRRACNDYLCRLIGKAIARGVHIRIGYGMGKERDAVEADRNQTNVYNVKEALKSIVPKSQAHLLEIKETQGVHQKILVCDRKFAITGSFNWLSYTGLLDDGYRNETGTLFRHPDQVAQLASIALKSLS